MAIEDILSNNVHAAATLLPWLFLLCLLLMVEVGSWCVRSLVRRGHQPSTVESPVFGAIFGLLALLITFTFSGAAGRFEERRQLIVKEARSIATASALLDLLPGPQQAGVRSALKRYVDDRASFYEDVSKSRASLELRVERSTVLSRQLWQTAVAEVRRLDVSYQQVALPFLGALTQMFDACESERLATRFHPPDLIWLSLAILALVGAFLSGYSMALAGKRDFLLVALFACLMAWVLYVTLNLEFARLGSIRMKPFDDEIYRIRDSLSGECPAQRGRVAGVVSNPATGGG